MGAMKRRNSTLGVILLLIAAAAIASCGSSATSVDTFRGPVGGGGEAAPLAPAPAVPSAAPSAASNDSLGASGFANNPPALVSDLKIVYTGSLQLVVADLEPALAKAKAAVAAVGGYIGASQESNDGDRPVATITYRIPATRWEDAIASLRGLATKVVAEQTQATEVGGQIVDLEARITNLRASEAALQTIAKGAGKVSDLLEVQAQLTDVRGQIEQLDGQRAQLTDQVAYGTMVATFGLEIVAVQETARGWDPAKEVDAATATLIGVGQTIVSGAIWFGIVWLPLILVLVVLAFIARLLFRRFAPRPRHDDPIPGWGDQG